MGSNQDINRVLIIGAGAAGLLIAQALKKEGIAYTIFEQDATPHARPRDWNYGIYWAQSHLDECLPPDLMAQVPSCQVDSHVPTENDYMPIFNGETGETIVDLPAPYSLRLKRRKFLKLISTGLDIKWGKRLTHVDSDGDIVTVTFDDGTHESGVLLIGAEGAHSRVREYLFGKEKAALLPTKVVSMIATPRLPADQAKSVRELHPRYCPFFHPNGHFAWVGIHDETGEPGDWEFLQVMTWLSDENEPLYKGDAILAEFKRRAAAFAEPFRSTFTSLPDDTKIWHSRLSYWETQPWDNHNGTVTLAGDSAHSMTFHRGQGLNNAILDAASFGREVAKLQEKTPRAVRQILPTYEKEVFERGKEAVASSNLNSLSVHNWEQLQQSPLFKMGLKKDSKGSSNTADASGAEGTEAATAAAA